MKYQRGSSEVLPVLLMIVFIVVGLLGVGVYLDSVTCRSKWELSGLKSQWGIMSGCLVQSPTGQWLPDDVVREIDLKPINKGEEK